MIKEKLQRIQDLYNTWRLNDDLLQRAASPGKRVSLRRTQVFLKEKITAALKDIQVEMQPKLFVVCVTNRQLEKKTVFMRAETFDDIKLYIQLLELIKGEAYLITSIQELPTIYEGHITFVVKP